MRIKTSDHAQTDPATVQKRKALYCQTAGDSPHAEPAVAAGVDSFRGSPGMPGLMPDDSGPVQKACGGILI